MDRFSEDYYGSRAAVEEYRPHCEECGEPAQERRRVYETPTPEWVCEACFEQIMADLEARDEECTCVQTDVDLFDARGCAAHGRAA